MVNDGGTSPAVGSYSGHGIIAGEIIASIVDITNNDRANPVPSSLLPSQKERR